MMFSRSVFGLMLVVCGSVACLDGGAYSSTNPAPVPAPTSLEGQVCTVIGDAAGRCVLEDQRCEHGGFRPARYVCGLDRHWTCRIDVSEACPLTPVMPTPDCAENLRTGPCNYGGTCDDGSPIQGQSTCIAGQVYCLANPQFRCPSPTPPTSRFTVRSTLPAPVPLEYGDDGLYHTVSYYEISANTLDQRVLIDKVRIHIEGRAACVQYVGVSQTLGATPDYPTAVGAVEGLSDVDAVIMFSMEILSTRMGGSDFRLMARFNAVSDACPAGSRVRISLADNVTNVAGWGSEYVGMYNIHALDPAIGGYAYAPVPIERTPTSEIIIH